MYLPSRYPAPLNSIMVNSFAFSAPIALGNACNSSRLQFTATNCRCPATSRVTTACVDESVDVVVVGAGIIGLTSAIRCRQAGYKVRIVAQETPSTILSKQATPDNVYTSSGSGGYALENHIHIERVSRALDLKRACDVAREANARVVLNCTGIGSKKFSTEESVTPGRGVAVRVRTPQGRTPYFITESEEDGILSRDGLLAYCLPRGNEYTLGGPILEGNWNTWVNPNIFSLPRRTTRTCQRSSCYGEGTTELRLSKG